jgi:hypothetical protein
LNATLEGVVRRLRQTVAPPTRAEVVAGEPIDRFAHVAICTTHCSRALAAVHGEEPPARLLGLLFYQLERLVAQPVRELDHRAGCASASAPGPSQCHRFSSARAGVALSMQPWLRASLALRPQQKNTQNRAVSILYCTVDHEILPPTKVCLMHAPTSPAGCSAVGRSRRTGGRPSPPRCRAQCRYSKWGQTTLLLYFRAVRNCRGGGECRF